jgi:hypothetical protein
MNFVVGAAPAWLAQIAQDIWPTSVTILPISMVITARHQDEAPFKFILANAHSGPSSFLDKSAALIDGWTPSLQPQFRRPAMRITGMS